MKFKLHKILSSLGAIAVFIILLGYGGALHPAGDSLAVFRAYASLGLIVIAVFLSVVSLYRRSVYAAAFGAGIFVSLGFLPFGPGAQVDVTAASGQVYHHYQKNLLYNNKAQEALLADILRRKPDTVTVQETNLQNQFVYFGLEDAFASHYHCPAEGVAVYARWEMIAQSGRCFWGVAAMQVDAPEGPLWVISTHLRWNYPYRNAAQVADLVPKLAALAGPKIVGGDFNTVPWADSFRRFAHAADVDRIGRVQVSYVGAKGALRVPIDHVLATGGRGRVDLLPRLGSDHFGIWATFTTGISAK